MIPPKEKAQEYLNKFLSVELALFAVDEILIALEEHQWQNINVIEYYYGVKKELENL